MRVNGIVFLMLIAFCNCVKAQSIDFCLLHASENISCKKFNIHARILKNTFNNIHDTTNYFSYESIDSILIIRFDSLPATKEWGGMALNIGEQIMYLHYKDDSLANKAFNNLIGTIEGASLDLFLFSKGGLALGRIDNKIFIYQPNGNPPIKRKFSIQDICGLLLKSGYKDIYSYDIVLKKFKP